MRCSALLLAALFVLGCSDDDDEHPPVLACTGFDCHGPPVLGSGASTGSGAGGESSTGELPVFSVTRFESDDFVTTAPYGEPAAVLADGEGGLSLEAVWNGVDPFALEGLVEEPFVLVQPSPSADAIDTLLVPALHNPVELPLVRATVVESILALSSQPLDRDTDRAQIVLTLIDVGTQQPIAGATLSELSAESVLYAAGGTWSDAVSETEVAGLAMLVNVEASAWPGKLTSVAVSGSAVGAIPLRAVAGAVTVLYVGIEL